MVGGERGRFYGAVTVSDRGQVVIPAEARRDLGIEVGERLLVVGGPAGGLLFLRATVVSQFLDRWTELARQMLSELGEVEEDDEIPS
ncbi:MAG TPA: AbrB/MazE/SpoVT family DNA-binding domain-containing protein [Anaerolineales bacterium]|nr:AbrB/MazE/SpoVT family DNA-binding domain-containing protein [Anaerolineae bacterium]HIP86821.1 AbrB/MazE/SpoVT family DNA-binding domain-containing protein [Anaerolineales bacterium]